MTATMKNNTRLNIRLMMVAVVLAMLPALALADCGDNAARDMSDYVVSGAGDGVTSPISLRPEDQPRDCAVIAVQAS